MNRISISDMSTTFEPEYIITDIDIIRSYHEYGLARIAKVIVGQMGVQHVIGSCGITYSGVMIGARYYHRITTMPTMHTDETMLMEFLKELPEARIVSMNEVLRSAFDLEKSDAALTIYIPCDNDMDRPLDFLQYTSRKLSRVVKDLENIKLARDMMAKF